MQGIHFAASDEQRSLLGLTSKHNATNLDGAKTTYAETQENWANARKWKLNQLKKIHLLTGAKNQTIFNLPKYRFLMKSSPLKTKYNQQLAVLV